MISCPIQEIVVQSCIKQHNCTWYPLLLILTNNKILQIKHRYADFVQFSRLLHQQFNLTSTQLPKIKKQHNLIKKGAQKCLERQCELQSFCHCLLLLPNAITCSQPFLSFFSTMTVASNTVSDSIKRVFSLKSSAKKQPVQDLTEISSALTTRLQSLPIGQNEQQQLCTIRSNIENLNRSNRFSTTSTTSTTGSNSILFSSSPSSTADEDETIKLKIIYDRHNIIIIRVSRSLSLDQLRSQVIQKFALINIQLPDQLVLRTVDCARYSSGSGSSMVCSVPADGSDLNTAGDMLISDEQDLTRAMLLKWNTLQKVTLRCVV